MNFIPGAVFHRQLNKPMVVATRAKGMWIEASDGKRYLDASGGAVVVNIGHCREEVPQAVFEQLRTLSYLHGDTPTALQIVSAIREKLEHHGVRLMPMLKFLS